MSSKILYLITIPLLFYISIGLGIAMKMATLSGFDTHQSRAFQWPVWCYKAFSTLVRDEKLKKSRIIKFFFFHLDDAIFLSMAAVLFPAINECISMSYEERIRKMYLAIQPKRRKK